MLTKIDLELPSTAKTKFKDFNGNDLEIVFDDITGSIIMMSYMENTSGVSTVVRRSPQGASAGWRAERYRAKCLRPQASIETCPPNNVAASIAQNREAGVSFRSMPPLSQWLADARYDEQAQELRLANSTFSKRWVFRTDCTSEFYSDEGVQSFVPANPTRQ